MLRRLNSSLPNNMNRLRSFPFAHQADKLRSVVRSHGHPCKKGLATATSIPDSRHTRRLVRARGTSTAGLIELTIRESRVARKQVERMKVMFTNAVMDLNRAAAVVAAMVVVEVAAMAVEVIRHIAATDLPTNDRMICDRASSDSSTSARTMTDSTTKRLMCPLALARFLPETQRGNGATIRSR